MSNKATGIVNWVGSKDVRGRKYWSFRIDTAEAWFRTGSDKPPINKGDSVSFTYEETQYGNQVAIDSIKVTQAETRPSAPQPSGGGGNNREDYWNKKAEDDKIVQKMIQFNHCTNAAINVAKLALDNGILPLGTGSKGNKMDALMAQIATIRNALYDDVDTFSVALVEHHAATGNLIMAAPKAADAGTLNDDDFEDA